MSKTKKKRKFLKQVVLATCFFVYAISSQACVDLGTYGAVWHIKERNAVTEIKKHLKQYDWHKLFSKQVFLKAFRRYEDRISTNLPTAKKHLKYTVDLTYTLPFNITDAQGNIIYPKGYTFNPLDYIHVPFTYVIFDGTDKKQILWLKSSPYYGKAKAMFLICKGDVLSLERELKVPVFYADKRIIFKFRIKYVPSIVYQKGDKLYVEAVPVGNSSHSVNNKHSSK